MKLYVSKADQLSRSEFGGLLGIVLCDGGYSPFHATSHFSTHSIREVIAYFLKNHPTISFVVTLIIKKDSYPRTTNEIVPLFYVNENVAEERVRIFDLIIEALDTVPDPQCDTFNAINHLKGGNPQEGNKNGALTMNSNEITISARILMELLAGRMSFQEFSDRYDPSHQAVGLLVTLTSLT